MLQTITDRTMLSLSPTDVYPSPAIVTIATEAVKNIRKGVVATSICMLFTPPNSDSAVIILDSKLNVSSNFPLALFCQSTLPNAFCCPQTVVVSMSISKYGRCIQNNARLVFRSVLTLLRRSGDSRLLSSFGPARWGFDRRQFTQC